MKVFYLKSNTDLTLPISLVTLDLNKPSEGGSTFLALDSVVGGTTRSSSGPSVEHRLDLGRPDGRGESRCKLFRGRSSVRFLHLPPVTPFPRFYTGFSPVFSRYNGENGLIGSVRVWQCDGREGLEDYLKETRSCSRVVPQCKVGFHTFFFELLAASSSLLRGCFSPGAQAVRESSWSRELGSRWSEATIFCSRCSLTQNDEAEGTEILKWIQVEYNPGTGFLTDDSGLVLSYQRRADLRPVGRLLVTSSEKLRLTSSLEQAAAAAAASLLCTSSCLSSQVSEKDLLSLKHLLQVSLVNVTSLSLWGSPTTDMVKVSVVPITKSTD